MQWEEGSVSHLARGVCLPIWGSASSNPPLARAAFAAFSLVELLLAMAIVATMAGIAAPRYANSLARYRAEAAARRLVDDLAVARNDARVSHTSRTVFFDTAEDSCLIPGVRDLKDSKSSYRVDYSKPPYRADLVSVDFNTTTKVTFDGFGTPDSGGTVVIKIGDEVRTVVLDPDSGKAVAQ